MYTNKFKNKIILLSVIALASFAQSAHAFHFSWSLAAQLGLRFREPFFGFPVDVRVRAPYPAPAFVPVMPVLPPVVHPVMMPVAPVVQPVVVPHVVYGEPVYHRPRPRPVWRGPRFPGMMRAYHTMRPWMTAHMGMGFGPMRLNVSL